MTDDNISTIDVEDQAKPFENGTDPKIVDGIMAQTIGVRSPMVFSAEPADLDIKAGIPAGIDEDDSILSTTSSELFDREPRHSNPNRSRGKLAIDGEWPRYGSSESATSTTVSSICSSVIPEEKQLKPKHLTQVVNASRKRLSDGSFKLPLNRQSSSVSLQSHEAQPLPLVDGKDQKSGQITVKRRGRPPKNKDAASPYTPKMKPDSSRASRISQLQGEVRPRSSIPSRIPVNLFASQCIEAAQASRLSPYFLHPGEHKILADLLMSKEVTVYLNIRNAILRLWHQNPLCSVTVQEAAGCAKEGRFFGLAEVAYKWLVRNGYINFGCVEVPRDPIAFRQSRKTANQKTVVVIGAGVSGLTTARQLEGLFAQNAENWIDAGQRPPRVIVLEGRQRIGGRVYSKPLRTQVPGSLPGDLRNTAEMGAMIVTGFEHGNPLDTIIRGQLGLRYHLMKDALTIYDCDGNPVNDQQDMLATELYTDISDRAGKFRALSTKPQTLGGDEELINRCRDPAPDGFESFQLEPLDDPVEGLRKHKPASRRGRRRNAPPGTEKLTGRTRVLEDSNATQSAARAAKAMGWQLRDGVSKGQTVQLNSIANASKYPTLGTIMDEAIEQYQDIVSLTPQDMRLLNWHHANLEYANAAPVSCLSLSGHDQDTGNEFEGAHSEIIGGYTQLPRGLMNLPTKLDVRFDSIVESIHYTQDGETKAEDTTKVVCTNGEVIEADQVVVTAPLGVLKSDMLDFDPPLPAWKQGAISRMGFGLLNKVILLYEKPFWDDSRDMFGLLNEAEHDDSLDPLHYEKRRGRFFLIWNASRICGRPMLVALMAGNAAHDAETTDSATLLAEINSRLHSVFGAKAVTAPLEAIVTRWKRDPFTRGTYSYVGPVTQPGDYDLMAEPVGNLHFAGEATCGTHPATVHGAFLSGLRVAAEVMESMAGPIALPSPLVGPLTAKHEASLVVFPKAAQSPRPLPVARSQSATTTKVRSTLVAPETPEIKEESDTIVVARASALPKGYAPLSRKIIGPPRQSVCAGDASFWARPADDTVGLSYEAAVIGTILANIGERPVKPSRPGVNPFLLYTKENWERCKTECGRESANVGRDVIRATLGRWWRVLAEEDKQPYLHRSQLAQDQADAQRRAWETSVAEWDAEAARIRAEYRHDPALSGHGHGEMESAGVEGMGLGVSRRKTNTSNCVVLDGV